MKKRDEIIKHGTLRELARLVLPGVERKDAMRFASWVRNHTFGELKQKFSFWHTGDVNYDHGEAVTVYDIDKITVAGVTLRIITFIDSESVSSVCFVRIELVDETDHLGFTLIAKSPQELESKLVFPSVWRVGDVHFGENVEWVVMRVHNDHAILYSNGSFQVGHATDLEGPDADWTAVGYGATYHEVEAILDDCVHPGRYRYALAEREGAVVADFDTFTEALDDACERQRDQLFEFDGYSSWIGRGFIIHREARDGKANLFD